MHTANGTTNPKTCEQAIPSSGADSGFALLCEIPRGTRGTPRGNCEGCGLLIWSEGGYRVPGVRGVACSIKCIETVLFGEGSCRWCGKKIDRSYLSVDSRLCSDDCATNYYTHVLCDRSAALGTGKRFLLWLQRHQPELYRRVVSSEETETGYCRNPRCPNGEDGQPASLAHLRADALYCDDACRKAAQRSPNREKQASNRQCLCGSNADKFGSLVSQLIQNEPGQKTRDLRSNK